MNQLADIIAQRIRERGSISLANFMELALYCPELGYYEKEKDSPGRRGDFFTSVSVGPLFGQLLAFQFADWLDALPSRGGVEFHLVEAGAHDGQLALDILSWFNTRRPDLLERLTYVLPEPSKTRREWQQRRLASFQSRVTWCDDLATFSPPGTLHGVILANEFLDALPLHRLGWDRQLRGWFEWQVGFEGDAFGFQRVDLPQDHHLVSQTWIQQLPRELLSVLPNGYTVEVCPAADAWWEKAARTLARGKMLTFDYGFRDGEHLAPERLQGTLRAYRDHRVHADVLACPGEQDITAHVNFAAMRSVGERCGLVTEVDSSQEQFLTRIFSRTLEAHSSFGPWDSFLTRQFQTLTRPDQLGRPFRVLVQSSPAWPVPLNGLQA